MNTLIWAPKGMSAGSACCKIPYHGYEISIAMDDSCGVMASMGRSYVKVFRDYDGEDVTKFFCNTDEVCGVTALTLKYVFSQIDMYGDRD